MSIDHITFLELLNNYYKRRTQMKTDFSEAKVGDEVYCLMYGKGKIIDNLEAIVVRFEDDSVKHVIKYDIRGHRRALKNRTLYYAGTVIPDIIPGPRPKRKVKKVVKGYIQVANMNCVCKEDDYCGQKNCVLTTITYEVEE